jgi:hypothetical protein
MLRLRCSYSFFSFDSRAIFAFSMALLASCRMGGDIEDFIAEA